MSIKAELGTEVFDVFGPVYWMDVALSMGGGVNRLYLFDRKQTPTVLDVFVLLVFCVYSSLRTSIACADDKKMFTNKTRTYSMLRRPEKINNRYKRVRTRSLCFCSSSAVVCYVTVNCVVKKKKKLRETERNNDNITYTYLE